MSTNISPRTHRVGRLWDVPPKMGTFFRLEVYIRVRSLFIYLFIYLFISHFNSPFMHVLFMTLSDNNH